MKGGREDEKMKRKSKNGLTEKQEKQYIKDRRILLIEVYFEQINKIMNKIEYELKQL